MPKTCDFISNNHNLHPRYELEEESKLIEASFEYVRYSDKDSVAIYRKGK